MQSYLDSVCPKNKYTTQMHAISTFMLGQRQKHHADWDRRIGHLIIQNLKSYLKFLIPHQRQYRYFTTKFWEATSLVKAAANIPNLKSRVLFLASQLVSTLVTLDQYCRSGSSKLLQSRKLGRQARTFAAFSLVHSAFQQENCRVMEHTYHIAPNTCTSSK